MLHLIQLLQLIRKGDSMSAIIIYGSCYGTTKQYAKELERQTGIEAISYDEIHFLEDNDLIIFLGALYAGGVYGIKKTFSKFDLKKKNLIIVTVGLADPQDETNKRNIENSVMKQISFNNQYQLFHLRGGIDYKALSFKHRFMMCLLYQKVKKMDISKQTDEMKTMIETYGKKVSFVDCSQLQQIISCIKKYTLR